MSQVNFFMLPPDEAAFFEALATRADTAVFPGRFFPDSSPAALAQLPMLDDAEPFLTVAFKPLLSAYPPAQVGGGSDGGLYHFDLFRSASIEWHRSSLLSTCLVAGRIYAKVGWLATAEDNRAYRSWYSSLERWLKSRYRRIESLWWVGPAAERWSSEGGLLALGDSRSKRITLRGAT